SRGGPAEGGNRRPGRRRDGAANERQVAMPSLVIVIATWASGGNLPPLLALAGLLRAAGHRVHVLSSDATREPALRGGFGPFAYRTPPRPPALRFGPVRGTGGGTAAHARRRRDRPRRERRTRRDEAGRTRRGLHDPRCCCGRPGSLDSGRLARSLLIRTRSLAHGKIRRGLDDRPQGVECPSRALRLVPRGRRARRVGGRRFAARNRAGVVRPRDLW